MVKKRMASTNTKSFGTGPVFFTAISTILGAILFLRFGYAVGSLGFWGVILIILLGHLVTIPTALAISELATNKRVEGGGEYFIISRSFGLNIGATIGFTLYMSQAISVAFYIIAFTEAFEFFFNWMASSLNIELPRQVISLPAMFFLSLLILKKGANIGVKMLYFVVFILFVSLILFFLGKTEFNATSSISFLDLEARNLDSQFFVVFAIIFPAFTGMTAGVGLSGDLKNPSKSIPLGTTLATISGIIVYFFIVYKLATSASLEDLKEHQLIMAKIAIGGSFVIPLGLAASTISSAIGSVLVAPRTLQALAADSSFPSKRINRYLSKGRGDTNEPYNATLVTVIIAFAFVALGNVNSVAEIISMFFMVTYGSLCLISFLYHFGSSPSYRPSFRSRWYISLVGFLAALWIMFKINTWYALAAVLLIVVLYVYVSNYHKGRKGLVSIFINALLQLNRSLQVYLQQSRKSRGGIEWRPSAVSISKDSFERDSAFQLLNWISHRFGFGTYIHLIEDYYSKSVHKESMVILDKLIQHFKGLGSHVYIDTLISPSYTSAIAQTIQLPGISGMENNMLILEYSRENPVNLENIIDNYSLINAGKFDVCILGTSKRTINFKNSIDVWLRPVDNDNSHLMILMSFIIQGHPDWRKAKIRIFQICKPGEKEATRSNLEELIITGRLPITTKNIEIIESRDDKDFREEINEKSANAALTIIGFTGELLKHNEKELFEGYDKLGQILFVNAAERIEIG
ncbi:amino acid permease [Bacteroidota bacterium]